VLRPGRRCQWGLAVIGWVLGLPAALLAEVPVEPVGKSEVLPRAFDPHWVWASDGLIERLNLVDADDGRFLGQIDSGWGMPGILFSPAKGELYVPETYFSRGTRGERSDVTTVYDATSLAPVAEVAMPPKRAINPLPTGNAALSDDERFLAVFNMDPATSLSIVDTATRSLAAEIPTPGCSLAYAAGPRRFAALCADGALLAIDLDDAGQLARRTRSAPFFDPEADPVTEKAVRWGNRWLFVSFEGWVHEVDLAGDEPRFETPWSLLDERDREQSWRIGGLQHLALHQSSGRLFSLVHRGGPDTHKDAGTEIWVYDLATRERVQRIEAHNPGPSVMGYPLQFGPDWLYRFALDTLMPAIGVDMIAVTQDDAPLLVTGAMYTAGLCVYDARSGELLRRIFTGGMTAQVLTTLPHLPAAATHEAPNRRTP